MSTLRLIGTGIAWSTLGSVVGKLVIFANLFIILRHLSLYEYGLSELVFSTISLLSIILLPGLNASVLADLATYRGQGDTQKLKGLFMHFMGLNLILGISAWAVLFFGSSIAAAFVGNTTISGYVQIVSFLFLMTPLRAAAIMLASVELRFIDNSFYSVCEEVAKCALLLLFFLGFHMGLDGLFYAAVLSQFIAFVVFLPRTLSAYAHMRHVVGERVGSLFSIVQGHRLWGIGTSYVNNLVPPLQLWVVRLMLGTEAVGAYAFAYGVYSQLASLLPLGSVLGPLMPRYIEQLHKLARLLRTSIKLQVVVGLVILIAAEIALPILGIIFPNYQTAIPLTHIMLLAIIPGSVAMMYGPAFNALKAQSSLFASMLVKVALTALLFYLGILMFGIWGLAIANIAVLALSTLERSWRLNAHLGESAMPLRSLFSIDAEERQYAKVLLERWALGRYVLARFT